MSAQAMLNPEMIPEERGDGILGGADEKRFLVMARADNVSQFHLSLREEDIGKVCYWESYGDGVEFIHEPVANSFVEFLKMLNVDQEMAMTLPWRDMKSVDDAPAVDVDFSAFQ